MPLAANNHPTQVDGARQSHYHMAEPIGLEPSPTFYTAPEYNDIASQNVLRTPVTTRAATPPARQGFDYISQSPFSASATSEQAHVDHHPSTLSMRPSEQFEGWAPPFRQNIFDSVDYGTPATQPMPQASMHYPAAPVTASHIQNMAYAQPQGPPFRTGSLGHPNVMPPPPHFGTMP